MATFFVELGEPLASMAVSAQAKRGATVLGTDTSPTSATVGLGTVHTADIDLASAGAGAAVVTWYADGRPVADETVTIDGSGALVAAPTAQQVRAEMDANSTQLAAIATDTGTNLPGGFSSLGVDIATVGATATAARTAAEAVQGKLPDGDRAMAGAGTTATNLDQVSGGGGGTVTAEDVSGRLTWEFPQQGSSVIASNTVEISTLPSGKSIKAQFDLSGVLDEDAVVATASSQAITGTGNTVGTPEIHTSKRRVLIPITAVPTAGLYIVSMTFRATDEQDHTVKGYLQVT